MSVPVVTPPTAPAPPVLQKPRASGPYRGASPLVWFVALLVVAVTLGPVLYAVLGGFRTNAQLAESFAGLPNPWVLENYQRVLTSASFASWREAASSRWVSLSDRPNLSWSVFSTNSDTWVWKATSLFHVPCSVWLACRSDAL